MGSFGLRGINLLSYSARTFPSLLSYPARTFPASTLTERASLYCLGSPRCPFRLKRMLKWGLGEASPSLHRVHFLPPLISTFLNILTSHIYNIVQFNTSRKTRICPPPPRSALFALLSKYIFPIYSIHKMSPKNFIFPSNTTALILYILSTYSIHKLCIIFSPQFLFLTPLEMTNFLPASLLQKV